MVECLRTKTAEELIAADKHLYVGNIKFNLWQLNQRSRSQSIPFLKNSMMLAFKERLHQENFAGVGDEWVFACLV